MNNFWIRDFWQKAIPCQVIGQSLQKNTFSETFCALTMINIEYVNLYFDLIPGGIRPVINFGAEIFLDFGFFTLALDTFCRTKKRKLRKISFLITSMLHFYGKIIHCQTFSLIYAESNGNASDCISIQSERITNWRDKFRLILLILLIFLGTTCNTVQHTNITRFHKPLA